MPKEHLLEEWKDPFYPTFPPPTAATTSATPVFETFTDHYRNEESRFRPKRRRKNEGNTFLRVT